MNAELPPFKNGEHNSESASTIDRVTGPLKLRIYATDGTNYKLYQATRKEHLSYTILTGLKGYPADCIRMKGLF